MTESEGKKTKYICPCGFGSYDLMEFLKHPFMGFLNKQDQEAAAEPKEEYQEDAPSSATGDDSA